MVRQQMIPLVLDWLYPLMVQELQLVRLPMMEMDPILVMFVFMITMGLHGCKLEEILMEKQQMIEVVVMSLYLLMGQELQLLLHLMMEMDPILVM